MTNMVGRDMKDGAEMAEHSQVSDLHRLKYTMPMVRTVLLSVAEKRLFGELVVSDLILIIFLI